MDCPSIPQISFNEFNRKLFIQAIERHIPVSGSIDLTYRCNLDCVHCYRQKSTKDKLSTKQIKNIIDQLVDAGCMWLTVSGGEPLMRPDFFEIYLYARKRGLIINLFTNAIAIDEKIADFLADNPPINISISLYGASEETYKKVTGKSAFKKIINALGLLIERKLKFSLKTMMIKETLPDLAKMREIAKSFDKYLKIDPNIIPTLDGNTTPYDHQLSMSEIIEIEKTDQKRLKEWLNFSSIEVKRSNKIFECNVGKNSFHINAFGKLQMCLMVKYPDFDLINGKFLDGWNIFPDLISGNLPDKSTCIGCEDVMFCNHCPGWSLIEYDNLVTKNQFLCKIARNIRDVFDNNEGRVDEKAIYGTPDQ